MRLLIVIFIYIQNLHAQEECWCFTQDGINIRDSPCGTVIGSGGREVCHKASGHTAECTMSGTEYIFAEIAYRDGVAWSAIDYLQSSECPPKLDMSPGICDMVKKINRSEWDARDPSTPLDPLPKLPVELLFVHHTAGSHCYSEEQCKEQVKAIQDFHMDTREWWDIGYNWLVGEDGQAYEGRGWEYVGGHTRGCNDVGVAVSMIGNFHPEENGIEPLGLIWDALHNVIDCAIEEGILVPWEYLKIFGHRDTCATACPGSNVYANITMWPWYKDDIAVPCGCD